ncbi:metal-dependent phosphoesterases (PHP family) [Chitinispirillum alkaliphilum]|nr:metal-dependent phosphoesterases (PHP family) [Chitinispirillum alkaliphilum]
MSFWADLHIHSCLSPCGSLDMSPSAIVKKAVERGINCLALSDHNSALNCNVMEKLCAESGIFFLPGLEVTTVEEAHVICLFDTSEKALELGDYIYKKLPEIQNIPEKFGDQVYVNEHEEIEGVVEKYLGLAAGVSVEELREVVFGLGGLFIPAHVDKPVFSVISQLGFLGGSYSAVEISNPYGYEGRKIASVYDYAFISSSDSHYTHQIGKNHIFFDMQEASFQSFIEVLNNKRYSINTLQ